MTITKARIYDITRVATSDEQDQKVRKQKQTDLTKEIISICENLGHQVKSASSSVDDALMKKIVVALQGKGINISLENLHWHLRCIHQNKFIC